MSAAELRRASIADEVGLAALWAHAFDAPIMFPQWSLDPERHARTIVAVRGGEVVGSVYGLEQRLRAAGGGEHRVLGIADVAVATSARGLGLARAMMDRIAADALDDGMDWALLFTGSPGVYRGAGYIGFSQRRLRRGRVAPAAPAESSAAALTVTSEPIESADLARLAPLHDAVAAGRPLSAVRSELGWRRARLWFEQAELITASEADGTCAAYAIVRAAPDAPVTVLEAGWRVGVGAGGGDAGARAAALAAVLRAGLARHGGSSLEVALPDAPEVESALAPLVDELEWVPDETAMFRPLAVDPSTTCRHHDAFHWTGDYL